jgi:CRISPR/Cas system-associated protein endoribonuclease Cas2
MKNTNIQIDFQTKKAASNFRKWFNKEGFDLFTKSKYNKLKKGTDDFVSCFATDEEYESGYYFELQ